MLKKRKICWPEVVQNGGNEDVDVPEQPPGRKGFKRFPNSSVTSISLDREGGEGSGTSWPLFRPAAF